MKGLAASVVFSVAGKRPETWTMESTTKSPTNHRLLRAVIIVFSTLLLLVTICLAVAFEQYAKPYRFAAAAFDLSTVVIPEGPVPLSEAEIERIIALEDPNFYEHNGWDYWAVGRGIVLANLSQKPIRIPSVSSLTSYVALRTYPRKGYDYVTSMFLVKHFEEHFTKEEILKLYVELYTVEKLRGNLARADRMTDSE